MFGRIWFGSFSKVNRSLEEIHLAKCGIRDFGAERLAENLVYNTTLKHLDLSWYVLGLVS